MRLEGENLSVSEINVDEKLLEYVLKIKYLDLCKMNLEQIGWNVAGK